MIPLPVPVSCHPGSAGKAAGPWWGTAPPGFSLLPREMLNPHIAPPPQSILTAQRGHKALGGQAPGSRWRWWQRWQLGWSSSTTVRDAPASWHGDQHGSLGGMCHRGHALLWGQRWPDVLGVSDVPRGVRCPQGGASSGSPRCTPPCYAGLSLLGGNTHVPWEWVVAPPAVTSVLKQCASTVPGV